MNFRIKTLVVVLVALAGLLIVSVASAASSGQGKGQGQSKHDDVLSYWTTERVAGAKARDIVLDGPSKGIGPQKKPDNPGGGNGGGGGKPGGGDSGVVNGSSWNGGGEVADTTGRVLFTLGGVNYVCSGSVVADSDPGRSIVVTAGHCVWDDGVGYATNWLFVSNYDSVGTFSGCATETNRCWAADQLVATAEWRASGDDYNNDVAFAVFTTGNSTGEMLDDAVGGGQAISFNEAAFPEIYAFGYPAAKKYDGSDLIYCAGPSSPDPYGGTTRGIECKMTGGSSGGPWMVGFDETVGTGAVNGVTSYSYRRLKNVLFGPVFGPVAQATYNTAMGNQ